ncbi:MAG: hypothetical protein KJO32_03385 [Deltaproteobacteria bacterium]|nr:hypothetical protein [Deltaproteobacteria bacterium]
MTSAFLIDKVLTNSILILFFYTCFATLALCIAYFIDEEVKEFINETREKRELLKRSSRPMDAVVDEIYES